MLLGERLIDGPDDRLVSLPLGRRTSGVELPLREAPVEREIDGELNRDSPEPGRTIWPSERPMDGELVERPELLYAGCCEPDGRWIDREAELESGERV